MELDANVLDLRVKHMVLSQLNAGIIVTMNCGGGTAWEVEGIEELVKEDCLVRGIAQGDVFGVTSRVSNEALFPGAPGDHPRAK